MKKGLEILILFWFIYYFFSSFIFVFNSDERFFSSLAVGSILAAIYWLGLVIKDNKKS